MTLDVEDLKCRLREEREGRVCKSYQLKDRDAVEFAPFIRAGGTRHRHDIPCD
jgi:hypothetical protein